MGGYFAAALFVNGVVLPYFPVFLHDRGLSGEEIALVLAMPYLLRIVMMPLVTGLADRVRERRVVVVGLAAALLALALVLLPLTGKVEVMVVAATVLVLAFTIGPLADAIAVSMERRGEGDYGRMRLWGSATFILGNLAGGAVMQHFGVPAVYWLMVIGFAIGLAASLMIPPSGPVLAAASAASLLVMRRPAFLAVLVAGGLIQASHAGLYGFATLTWQQRGFDETTIGALWAVGVIAEIILFAFAARIPGRVQPVGLLVAGGLLGVVRWGLFVVDTPVAATALVQVMHAGSFALAHLGMMRFIREMVPEERSASAQGTYVIFVGLAMAAATALFGRLWTLFDAGAFLSMSAFCATGVAILIAARPAVGRLSAAAGSA